jgi:hypothetical protein
MKIVPQQLGAWYRYRIKVAAIDGDPGSGFCGTLVPILRPAAPSYIPEGKSLKCGCFPRIIWTNENRCTTQLQFGMLEAFEIGNSKARDHESDSSSGLIETTTLNLNKGRWSNEEK